ncbi:serine--tRNA ligase [Buchnera aphidicola]|uniref:Serine--tRNA ligase n=1 Tax=Buchnera aphidicola (Therioaphis trifolii) TaxID=1241884 RepID=A0A4D6YDR7_9GAMM|nr:serine--tRNA ligase [Buchnera aphidicola]QCI27212.1 serine--tRNA ligase [Buchnera aphidicola (Therioaphis trifolii)]
MINPYLLRHQIDIISKKLETRGFILDKKYLFLIEKKRKELQIDFENLRHKYKKLSQIIGKNKNIQTSIIDLKKQVLKIKEILKIKNNELKKIKKKIKKFTSLIPNIPDSTVPIGNNYINNLKIKSWGKIKKYNFNVQDHIELGKKINGFDWFSASEMSGARFVIMKNKMALLYRAIGQLMLDVHTMEHGYIEMNIPYLVNKNSMYGTGQLPKFKEELFYVSTINKNQKNDKYILIPTAEVPLTNLFRNMTIKENDLPIKLTAYSPCFRSENLSYGKDTRGLIRLHQFDKVELFQITNPENSMFCLEQLTLHAEKILKLLKLPYRKMLLCTGDMGFAATKSYDLEVWFPSQNTYREISSCSNMSDFQTRRIQAKYYQNKTNKKILLHTINGSGLAIGRTLAAILENYQNSNGLIEIPEILSQKYLNGMKFLN